MIELFNLLNSLISFPIIILTFISSLLSLNFVKRFRLSFLEFALITRETRFLDRSLMLVPMVYL